MMYSWSFGGRETALSFINSHTNIGWDKRQKLTSVEKPSSAVGNLRRQDQFLANSSAPHSAGQQEPNRIRSLKKKKLVKFYAMLPMLPPPILHICLGVLLHMWIKLKPFVKLVVLPFNVAAPLILNHTNNYINYMPLLHTNISSFFIMLTLPEFLLRTNNFMLPVFSQSLWCNVL